MKLTNTLTIFLLFIYALATTDANANIPAEEYFKPLDASAAAIRPDGKKVALIRNAGSQRLVSVDVASGAETVLVDVSALSNKEASINKIRWIDNRFLAAQFVEIKAGVKDLLDTKISRYLLLIEVSKAKQEPVIRSVRTSGRLVSALPAEEDAFLYAKSGPYSKIYRIAPSQLMEHKQKPSKLMKIDNGQFKKSNELASIKGYATRWFINDAGHVGAVLHYNEKRDLVLSKFNHEGENQQLKSWSRDSLIRENRKKNNSKFVLPVAQAMDEDSFYGIDLDEEEERSVYLANYKTNQVKVVYEASSYKIVDLIITGENNQLVGVQLLKNGNIHYVYFDKDGNTTNEKELAAEDANISLAIDQSLNGEYSLIYEESHNQPGRYYLKQQGKKSKTYLGGQFPHLNNHLKSRQIEGSVMVEGLNIPYLLTLPEQSKNGPAPLVVYPHGGPIGVFDNRYFDPGTQFFAANGFAVLRVNFRGSSGHNAELKEAGKRQWGGLMLSDIHAATKEVIARDDISAEKVCAVGFSYGGYAATELTVRYPDFFSCAATVAGVSDVNLYLNKTGRSSNLQDWFTEYVGDSTNDYDYLKSISPVYADQLPRPLLIIHGEQDSIVEIEHAYRLRKAASHQQTPFEWKIYPGLGHHISEPEIEIDIYARIKKFLKTHL